MSPFGREMNPFGGEMSPFGREMNPFCGEMNPFGREMNPFCGEMNPFGREMNPFPGEMLPFYGKILAFCGKMIPFCGNAVSLCFSKELFFPPISLQFSSILSERLSAGRACWQLVMAFRVRQGMLVYPTHSAVRNSELLMLNWD